MSKTILRKTSGFLIAMMIVSMLVPVLASAAMTFKGTFSSNGTVSGQVYFDGAVGDAVYNQTDVTLSVYGKNGEYIKDVTVSYATYTNGTSYYNIPSNTVINSVYDAVYFQHSDGSVTDVVYRAPVTPPTGCTYCGGGGGGGGGSWPSGSTINSSNGTVSANELKNALSSYTEVTIKVTGDMVSIPVSALLNAKEGAVLIIVTDNGTYFLPLAAFDFEELAKSVESNVADLKLNVGVKKLTGDDAEAVTKAITAVGGKALANAADFSISIEGTNGKKADIDSFDRYVKRKLPVTTEKTKTATVALYNKDTKSLSFVPSIVSSTEAEFWRTGNSVYTVIELNKSFSDIASHWGKADIELLAGKLIVDGVTDTTFEPDRNITRAEFAALVVRSLGLSPVTSKAYFNDVTSNAWYTGVVNAAAKAGIVDGYEDGTFRPNAQITREELAAMVVRSFEYAGGKVEVDASAQAQILSKWSDANKIIWGQLEVAKAIKAGFINGMTDTTLETNGKATRAQTAAMVKRFLTEVKFID
ncbi:S-layer homology domain-containing protein [Paenibacillus mesophilus]|uniref:S-layer homology domain-containing protein n=1 Tax=Paenibacillus mesophilus TaxID=2582849 RepID=UPI0013051ACC|nr:S-layer homology domain-containing protein [Paenibacillus mesophilus]